MTHMIYITNYKHNDNVPYVSSPVCKAGAWLQRVAIFRKCINIVVVVKVHPVPCQEDIMRLCRT